MLGPYQLHDLVQLDSTTGGVIVKIERDAAKVLTSASSLLQPDFRICKVTDIMHKVKSRGAITTDAYQNPVRGQGLGQQFGHWPDSNTERHGMDCLQHTGSIGNSLSIHEMIEDVVVW